MEVKRVHLKDFTTLGVGGPAELWLVETLDDLARATEAPYRILGNGSNLLVADEGVPERVIKLGGEFARWDLDGWIGAGALLPQIVQEAAKRGRSGLEGLLGIPASVGGAVRMNAGTRFGTIAEALAEIEYFHEGRLIRVGPEALDFGYRKSGLPEGSVVTRVRLDLKHRPSTEILARMRRVDQARKGQPKRKSAGCAFKKPAGGRRRPAHRPRRLQGPAAGPSHGQHRARKLHRKLRGSERQGGLGLDRRNPQNAPVGAGMGGLGEVSIRWPASSPP